MREKGVTNRRPSGLEYRPREYRLDETLLDVVAALNRATTRLGEASELLRAKVEAEKRAARARNTQAA